MMAFLKPTLLLVVASVLPAQDLSKLPEWAREAARESLAEKAPEEADAWVLLNRTEIEYRGKGELRVRRCRLSRILKERGLSEAGFAHDGLGGRSGRVRSMKGWNLRPDGELEKVNKSDAVEVTDASRRQVLAGLSRVVTGSLVAYESEETIRHPLGPLDATGVMESNPIRHWELVTAGGTFQVDCRNLLPWIPASAETQGRVILRGVPSIPKEESWVPGTYDGLPRVMVRVLDPDLKGLPGLTDWNAFARWIQSTYREKASPARVLDLQGLGPVEALTRLHGWMRQGMTYRQVYLAPERGWVPDSAAEIARKRFGDCKDLTTLFLSEAGTAGLNGYPALVRVFDGHARPEDPVGFAFNHVIAAIALPVSLGLPSEVTTPQGRFLLVDPTARLTRLGVLPSAFRHQQVMICREEGALWVSVPDSALEEEALKLQIEGEINYVGGIEAEVRIEEVGDAHGLRSVMLEGGRERLKARLAGGMLDLPGDGRLDLLEVSDPMDPGQAFTVKATIRHPLGLRANGDEMSLVAWGMPGVPAPLVKPGETRRFPLDIPAGPRSEVRMRLVLPRGVTPLLASLEHRSGVRDIAWKAVVDPSGPRHVLELSLVHVRKAARFTGEGLARGLADLKADRALLRRLHEDGLAFRVAR